MKEDKKLEELCKTVSDHLFNNTEKYNPYSKVIITGTGIEVVEGVLGIPVKRYEDK